MPGNGQTLLWNETTPAETDIADAAPSRSIETSLRFGLAVEHNWPNSSGPNFGYHLLGSSRAYYDVESNVSSSGTDGRTMVTSDTSRLFHVGSAGTMFLGGSRVLSAGSVPVGGQNFYWAEEFGYQQVAQGSTGIQTVSFPNSGFSGIPFVWVSAVSDGLVAGGGGQGICLTAGQVSTTALKCIAVNVTLATTTSNYTISWRSLGTRVL